MIHEWLWLGLLSVILARLLYHACVMGVSAFDLNYLPFIGFIIVCIAFVFIVSKSTLFVLRCGFYIVLMNILFVALREISPLINPHGKLDGLLHDIDCFLFGEYPGFIFDIVLPSFLTEFMSFFYLLFLAQLFFFFIYYLLYRPNLPFFMGLMSLYAIGFMGYIFIPAVGPYATLHFEHALEGYRFYELLSENYTLGSNLTDVFPSLHCAVSAYILIFNYFVHRFWYRIWVFPTIILWCSTIYLRYHYAIDCIAGLLLAAVCGLYISRKLRNSQRK